MKSKDKERIVSFLNKKMCGPCRRDGANPDHPACVEAAELIEIIDAEPSESDHGRAPLG